MRFRLFDHKVFCALLIGFLLVSLFGCEGARYSESGDSSQDTEISEQMGIPYWDDLRECLGESPRYVFEKIDMDEEMYERLEGMPSYRQQYRIRDISLFGKEALIDLIFTTPESTSDGSEEVLLSSIEYRVFLEEAFFEKEDEPAAFIETSLNELQRLYGLPQAAAAEANESEIYRNSDLFSAAERMNLLYDIWNLGQSGAEYYEGVPVYERVELTYKQITPEMEQSAAALYAPQGSRAQVKIHLRLIFQEDQWISPGF